MCVGRALLLDSQLSDKVAGGQGVLKHSATHGCAVRGTHDPRRTRTRGTATGRATVATGHRGARCQFAICADLAKPKPRAPHRS
jgi:hypothetical protein